MKRTTTTVALSALLAAALFGAGCSGTLNPRVQESIATQMKMQRRGLARCYSKALQHDRRTRGQVTLSFTVSEETGEFTNVRVARRTVRDPKLVRCLARRTLRLRADPKPEKPVDVIYTVDFRPLRSRRRPVAATEPNATYPGSPSPIME